MSEYVDCWYRSDDGLRLYARDYACTGRENAKAPLMLCLHGLTRNSADFHEFACVMRQHYRVVAVDQRGRGLSDYDDNPANYTPLRYVQDMALLLAHLQIQKVTVVGTSMGGLMAMMMAAMFGERLNAVVINDIGPEVAPEGLERIKAYVGQQQAVKNWAEAVTQAKQINGDAFPDFSEAQWQAFTRGIYRVCDGVPVLAYDPAISQPLLDSESHAVPPDLWLLFDALKSMPVLVVRGEFSDVLDRSCILEMQSRKTDLQVVEVPNRGHAPMLVEPQALDAVRSFLQIHNS